MAVAIETWAGYNDEGEEIKRFKAADATNDIDPEEVKTAIENVKQRCDEEFKSISDKLTGLTDGALNALRIEGATLQEYIDQIGEIVNQFGTEIISKELLERFQKVVGKELHPWLRRGIFFTHRAFNKFLDAYENGEPVFLYTGRGPSTDAMHIGHLIPFMFIIVGLCKFNLS